MKRQRPTILTVTAILNLILGGLGLCGYLCMGAVIIFLVAVIGQAVANMPKDAARDFEQMKEIVASLGRDIPGIWAFYISQLAVGAVLTLVLLASGVGLLLLARWGRVLALSYSILAIVAQLGALGVQYFYLNPAIKRWGENFVAQHGGKMAADQNPFQNTLLDVFGTALNLGYAIFLLIVMFLPAVTAAFSRTPESYADVTREEEEDTGYERGWGQNREEG
jgi:hypothetical protein